MLKTRINNRRLALCVAALAALHFPVQAQQKAGAAEQSQGSAAIPGPVVPPLIILAPTEVRTDPTLARGCWVRLFPEAGYKGTDDLTIAGPTAITSLRSPTGGASGVLWKSKAESVIVGPKASVTVYEHQDFKGPSARLQSGTKEPTLRNSLKLTQSIDSLTVTCSK